MHPILFKIGPVTIYSYGLMVALGFIVATMLASRTAKDFNIPPDRIATLSLVVLIWGIAGARILYILLNLKEFLFDPIEMLKVTHGGLVFYGGAILAFLSGIIYLKIAKTSILDTADVISPYIALGHSLGRIGCFLNGCCFGKPASLSWGMMAVDGIARHPTQIYSSFLLLFLYIFLRARLRYRRFKGQVFFCYLTLYPIGRFFMEFLRGDNPAFFFNLTFSQLVSIGVFIIGILGYFITWKKTNSQSR